MGLLNTQRPKGQMRLTYGAVDTVLMGSGLGDLVHEVSLMTYSAVGVGVWS